MNLIYQISVGKPSKLYETCIASCGRYAKRIGADHIVQTEPLLSITPDPNTSGRSKEATARLGYLPIFEKESAFGLLPAYDKIGVIDADVYIKDTTTKNIFDEFDTPFCAMRELDLPMLPWYDKKLKTYSVMQYGSLWPKSMFINGIAPFRNMGVMLFTKELQKYIRGTPIDFIRQPRFKKFVDGVGNFKWSTDQTLLNWWLHEDRIATHDLNWKWNCLYTAVPDKSLKEAYAVHFFLKDKLPQKGENIDQLLKDIH